MSEKRPELNVKWCWRFQNKNPPSANGIFVAQQNHGLFVVFLAIWKGLIPRFGRNRWITKCINIEALGGTQKSRWQKVSLNFITQTRGGSTCCHTLKAVYSFCWFRTNASPVSSMVSCIDFMTPLFCVMYLDP